MLDKYFERHWRSHPIRLSLFAGIFFTSCAFFFSYILFRHQPHLIGLTSIFFTLIFAMPLFSFLFLKEEKLEKKEKSFFKKNHAIIDYHLYFFVGVLVVFTILSAFNSTYVFNLNDFFNVKPSTLDINLPPPSAGDTAEFLQIFRNNAFIIGISFLLMLFFGSGGLFLLVFNASIAGSLIGGFIGSSFSEFVCTFSIFQIHFVPEIFGFLLAAIAGGIFYIDISREKLFSSSFWKVAINSGLLIVLAIACITVAALLEVFVVKDLFFSEICTQTPYLPFLLFIVISVGLLYIENHRQRIFFKKKK